MCGIVAFTGEQDDRLLAQLTDTVAHRGPDDAGHATFDACSLGHRRLSIIDLTSGHQPLSTPDGRFTITYNGELYNYRELRAQLSGYRFRTQSDTEVILAAYATWGMDAVDRFNGMWAFAIWDQRERTLFLSRDRYGIKPLYLTRHGERWVVASEVKAFLALPGFRPSVDDQTLIETLTFRFPPGDATMFAGVRRLPPGTNALVRNGTLTEHRYFTPRWEYRDQDEDDVQRQVARLLDAAVERHLIADVPVGLFLSGGLDSSLLTAIVASKHPAPKTFTIGFADSHLDESASAAQVAAALGTTHQSFPFDDRVLDDPARTMWHLEEPIADATIFPVRQLAAETRKTVTVALSGDGADEFFGGYPKYRALDLLERYRSFGRLVPPFPVPSVRLRRALAALRARDRATAYLELVSVFTPEETAGLLHPDRSRVDRERLLGILRPHLDSATTMAQGAMAFDVAAWLPNDILLKTDKMAMAHGLEVRVPYLDTELTEYLMTVPASVLSPRRQTKQPIRRRLAELLPHYPRQRRKQGFTVPIAHFRPLIETTLTNDRLARQRLFRADAVERLRRRNPENPYVRRQLLSVLMVTLWHEVFVEGVTTTLR